MQQDSVINTNMNVLSKSQNVVPKDVVHELNIPPTSVKSNRSSKARKPADTKTLTEQKSALTLMLEGTAKKHMMPAEGDTLHKYGVTEEPAFFNIFIEKRHAD
jgi:hypothetical protein